MSAGDVWPTRIGIAGMSEEDIVRRCRELLDDPVLAGALNDLDADAVLAWRQAVVPSQREECWHRCAAIIELRNKLQSALDNVKLMAARERRRTVT